MWTTAYHPQGIGQAVTSNCIFLDTEETVTSVDFISLVGLVDYFSKANET